MSELKFNEKTHKYSKGKIRYTSVTEFISKFFEEFDDRALARKLNKMRGTKWYKMGIRKILSQWKEQRDYGTRVHEEIDNLITEYSYGGIVSEETKNAINWLHQFERGLGEPIEYSEYRICDDELKLAGTIDLMIESNLSDESIMRKVDLVDWKVTKEISYENKYGKKGIKKSTKELDDCNFIKYSLQLNLYAYILQRKGIMISSLRIIHLTKEEAKEYIVPCMFDVIKSMLKEDGR